MMGSEVDSLDFWYRFVNVWNGVKTICQPDCEAALELRQSWNVQMDQIFRKKGRICQPAGVGWVSNASGAANQRPTAVD